jgi:hypothetical protein
MRAWVQLQAASQLLQPCNRQHSMLQHTP